MPSGGNMWILTPFPIPPIYKYIYTYLYSLYYLLIYKIPQYPIIYKKVSIYQYFLYVNFSDSHKVLEV